MSSFYNSLNVISDHLNINSEQFVDAPKDWFVALTDVQGSTQAIEQGRYRDVNGLAVASIVAISNIDTNLKLPFVFGGDGAVVLIPPELYTRAQGTLVALRTKAQKDFDLTLRVGIVPIEDVYQGKKRIQGAILAFSEHSNQTIFIGGGLAHAEELVKATSHYHPKPTDQALALDLSGFHCRWQPIISRHGEIVSLIVTQVKQGEHTSQIFREVYAMIENYYGDTSARSPITQENLRFTLQAERLKLESTLTEQHPLQLMLRSHAHNTHDFAQRLVVGAPNTALSQYKARLLHLTDNEKIDDNLRMIISGSRSARQELVKELEKLYQKGLIYYGVHVSDQANLTCMVKDFDKNHFHFIDGGEGGYTQAARMLKAQIKKAQSAS